jgi:hypothetical protein
MLILQFLKAAAVVIEGRTILSASLPDLPLDNESARLSILAARFASSFIAS